MESIFVDQFARTWRPRTTGATVRRVVAVADGLVLELQSATASPIEIGIVVAVDAAWVWGLGAGAREQLTGTFRDNPYAELVTPQAALGWRDPGATPLDALRAWLLRPGSAHPAWNKLEGARLVDLEPRSGDRVLRCTLEAPDAVRGAIRLELVLELFDRGGNLILRADGAEIANRRGRPETPARPAERIDAAPSSMDLAAAAYLDLATVAASALGSAATKRLRREVERVERRLAKLDREVEAAAESEEWRQQAELLAANLHRVPRGATRIVVDDFFADGAPREIALEPSRSAQDNLAELFRKARRLARGRDTIESRRQAAVEELAARQAAAESLVAGGSWADVVRLANAAWREACPEAPATPLARLWAPGGPDWRARRAASAAGARGATAPRDDGPGRRIVLDGGWEVRVGRSNVENDALTHKFARPDDVWLHASGVPGSHVVLRMQGKTDNPPRDVLEVAAAIAARFSKAKHAGTVPVVWTRKRYVRKPRGAPAGTATCTHEKTVFVRPGLPEGAADES